MSFEELGLCKEIISSINEKGYKNPTEIQKEAIPHILMGRDILGCAQTGTGKTGSFVMPLAEILNIGKILLINPKEITIIHYSSTSSNIDSYFFNAYNKNKLDDLKILLNIDLFKSAVIFCNKKNDINKVNTFLKKNNYKTVCLHGDMDQSSRTNSLEEFKNKTADILVASDVAARGIDIKDLSHVFNYDVPNNPEDYVHRIGRTGRAGKKGKAYTIFKEDDEKNILLIEKLIKKKIKNRHR